MSNFFSVFPTIPYNFGSQELTFPVHDITRRFKFREQVFNNRFVYYTYTLKEGERPDMIAHKYYGDSSLDWILLIANNIYDPIFDWHMPQTQFESYLEHKYGSLEYAYQTIHHYEIVVNEKEEIGYAEFSEQKTLRVDFETFNATPQERRKAVSIYDYEDNINETRRQIKIVDKSFVPQILEEYNRILT